MKIFLLLASVLSIVSAQQYKLGIESFDFINVRYSNTQVYQWANAIIQGVRFYDDLGTGRECHDAFNEIMDGIYEVNEFMNQRDALNTKERMYPIARSWNDYTSVLLFESY
jgi:hypothetical protein